MSRETELVRVLLADDQQLIRDGIASLLRLQPGIEIVGDVENGKMAIEQAETLKPDLILMDIRMPMMDGIEATAKISQAHPQIKILMLTTFDDADYIIRALRAGACGYLLKNLPAADLAQAIKLANEGIFQLAPTVAGKLVGNYNAIAPTAPKTPKVEHDLTKRELDVLKCIADGDTNQEIADKLIISMGTVKSHVSNILNRLELRDRVQAAIFARENGLV
ncbi:MAG: response regulator transcription factor [Chloroflexota bacterium]